MGWASGSSIADDVWAAVKKFIPKPAQAQVAKELIDIFESHDCDTMAETAFWSLVWKKCPKCKGEGMLGDTLDGGVKYCEKCEGNGEIKR